MNCLPYGNPNNNNVPPSLNLSTQSSNIYNINSNNSIENKEKTDVNKTTIM